MMRVLSLSCLYFFLLLSCTKEVPVLPQRVIVTPMDTLKTDTAIVKDTVSNNTYAYLALGDSYTIGESVSESDRYPVQTAALLKQEGIHFFAPEVIARTGWTTADLLRAINNTAPSQIKYDIVTLLIGVNNQYQGLSRSQYTEEFTSLLNKAIAYAGNNKGRMFVLSIPDYSVTPFGNGSNAAFIAKEIDAFNEINKEITTNTGIQYIDITSSTRLAANDPSLTATDGLHPSGKEYAKWAALLAPLVKKSLQ